MLLYKKSSLNMTENPNRYFLIAESLKIENIVRKIKNKRTYEKATKNGKN